MIQTALPSVNWRNDLYWCQRISTMVLPPPSKIAVNHRRPILLFPPMMTTIVHSSLRPFPTNRCTMSTTKRRTSRYLLDSCQSVRWRCASRAFLVEHDEVERCTLSKTMRVSCFVGQLSRENVAETASDSTSIQVISSITNRCTRW